MLCAQYFCNGTYTASCLGIIYSISYCLTVSKSRHPSLNRFWSDTSWVKFELSFHGELTAQFQRFWSAPCLLTWNIHLQVVVIHYVLSINIVWCFVCRHWKSRELWVEKVSTKLNMSITGYCNWNNYWREHSVQGPLLLKLLFAGLKTMPSSTTVHTLHKVRVQSRE